MKHSLGDALELRFKSIDLVHQLVNSVLSSLYHQKKVDTHHVVIAEVLVYLLENSTELFLKDLFVGELSKKKTADTLIAALNMAYQLPDQKEKTIFLSLIFQIFQVITEVEEIALSALTTDLYIRLLEAPMAEKGAQRESYLIYLDKMIIVINLSQFVEEIMSTHPNKRASFDNRVTEFFSYERFCKLKEQLCPKNKLSLAEMLENSRKEMVSELKEKKNKKQKKELEASIKSEWLDQLDEDKHVFVALGRLYEAVS